jgi:hypothetical protein
VLLGLPAALALIVFPGATRIVPPIFGRIVDAATGEPVRGVVVTLEYTRYHGLGSTETVLHSQATTNRWGWFWLMRNRMVRSAGACHAYDGRALVDDQSGSR